MSREQELKNELSIRARYQRKLDAVLLIVEEVMEETSTDVHGQIEVVSDKIQNELEDND